MKTLIMETLIMKTIIHYGISHSAPLFATIAPIVLKSIWKPVFPKAKPWNTYDKHIIGMCTPLCTRTKQICGLHTCMCTLVHVTCTRQIYVYTPLCTCTRGAHYIWKTNNVYDVYTLVHVRVPNTYYVVCTRVCVPLYMRTRQICVHPCARAPLEHIMENK